MRRRQLAAALLLVYPALLLAGSVSDALRHESLQPIIDKLPLVIAPAAVAVGVMRGRRWAYGAALVFGAGVAAIVPLYWYAATLSGGPETWRGMSAIGLASAVLAPLASGAAFVLLLGDATGGDSRRRILRALLLGLGMALGLMALIALFGIDGMDEGVWYQVVLGATQVPGLIILRWMGFCCGFLNSTIISDMILPHWGGIVKAGIPALVAANTIGLLPLTLYLLAKLDARRESARPGEGRPLPAPEIPRDP
jgi:hypothetical protein